MWTGGGGAYCWRGCRRHDGFLADRMIELRRCVSSEEDEDDAEAIR